MRVREYDEPWKHHVIDDFLDEFMFDLVQSTFESMPKAEANDNRHFILKKEGYELLHRTIYESYAYYITRYVDPKLLEKTVRLEYSSCGNGFEYKLHRDNKDKIYSVVLYISEEGNGTRLYDTSGQTLVKEVQWVPNRAVGFYRGEDTFHSYYSAVDNRQTVNCWVADK